MYVAWTDWEGWGLLSGLVPRLARRRVDVENDEVRISDRIGYQPVAENRVAVDAHDASNPPALLCVWNDWRGNVPTGRYPNVFFARLTDGGATWSNPNVRVNDLIDYYQQAAKRAIATTSTGAIAIGWYNDDFVGPSEMRVSRSTDHGATWGASVALSEPATGSGVCPTLSGRIADDRRVGSSRLEYLLPRLDRRRPHLERSAAGRRRRDRGRVGPPDVADAGRGSRAREPGTRDRSCTRGDGEPGQRDPAAVGDDAEPPAFTGLYVGPNPARGGR